LGQTSLGNAVCLKRKGIEGEPGISPEELIKESFCVGPTNCPPLKRKAFSKKVRRRQQINWNVQNYPGREFKECDPLIKNVMELPP